ncbi:MAG TPA: sialidase family protein [Terriglobales bacterium]|nr:sialidase family protein [Terriglobales bacterium]
MKFSACLFGIVITVFCLPVVLSAQMQRSQRLGDIRADLGCSPAPCRLPNVRVTQGGKTTATASNVAIHPSNPSQLILGVTDPSCSSWQASYSSNDGGTTWTKTCFPFVGIIDEIVQSWILYDSSGEVHALLHSANLDCGEDQIFETHSSDNGLTWSALNRLLNVQFAVLDSEAIDNNAGSPFAGNIYGSSTEFLGPTKTQIEVFRSSDGGTTWTSTVAATLPNTFGFDSEGFSSLQVGKDGTVYMAYMASPNGSSSPNEMMFVKSADGGQTWSSPVQIYTATAVADIPNTTISVADAPVLAVDNSAAGKSRLYVTFYNWTGSFMQVLLTHSGNGGNSWSTPVPVAPANATNDQFKPYVSVSSTGAVGVTWLDRRDDPSNVNYRTYGAFSRNGIFSRNIALATASSAPTGGLFLSDSPAANAWTGSTLYVVWPDTRTNGVLQQFIGGDKQQ